MGQANPEFLKGTLDMLILRTLSRGPNHGYGIALHIRRLSQEAFKVGEGSLYPALLRLLVNSWVRAEWGTTLANIDHFTPTGDPDAPHESYAEHL